jgi:hypothetical protein
MRRPTIDRLNEEPWVLLIITIIAALVGLL